MKIRRSRFNRSMTWDGTLKPGYWIPIFCKPTLPGDKWKISVKDIVRNFARLAPTYGIESIRIAAFEVQNKDIWNGWWDFRTGGMDNMDTSAIPYMIHKHSVSDVGFETLSDYLGTAPALTFYTPDSNGVLQANSQALRSRCLAERAYAKIGRDYLMRQDLEDENDYPLSTDGAENGEDTTTNRGLFPCHWNHDYFTNQVTSQIKGAQVTIPIGTEAPVIGNGDSLGLTDGTVDGTVGLGLGYSSQINQFFTPFTTGQAGTGTYNASMSSNRSIGVTTDPTKSGMIAKLDSATGFTLRTLNMAVAVEKIGNNLMRHGSRPVEWLNTFFGVKSSDARLDRAIFLGSYSTDFITSPVTQTSATDAVTPQGHQAGQGFHAAKYPTFKAYCEEDGWIMILAAIRPKTSYCQGLPAYHNYSSRYDYPNPIFQHLDYVASKESEIYATGVTNGDDTTDWDNTALADNGKFGLHPIFQEWRSFPSEIHGEMLNTLKYWHTGRIFANAPQLNKAFIQVGNTFPLRQFAIQNLSYSPYIAHFDFNITLDRKLSKFGTPKYFGVM